MSRIALVTTGGTLATVPRSRDFPEGMVGGRDLLNAVPGLIQIATVEVVEAARVSSVALTLNQLAELATTVGHLAADPAITGVVVTHGTDTLEETAYFLDLVVGGETPVVVTGAMRGLAHDSPDGPASLLEATKVAISEEARGQGVLVALNGHVHLAPEVTKFHTASLDAFQSPEFGPAGVVEEGKVRFLRTRQTREILPLGDLTAWVELLKMCLDPRPRLLDALVDGGADGVVIEGLGGGHLPPQLVPSLERGLARGLAVVMVTRCPTGRVFMDPDQSPGSVRHLHRMGVMFAPLSGPKARLKLILALSLTRDRSALRGLFPDQWLGE